jgi:hypothetical protein
LPDALSEKVKEFDVPLSAVCQQALQREVNIMETRQAIGSDKIVAAAARLRGESLITDKTKEERGYQSGQDWALEMASSDELEQLYEISQDNWLNFDVGDDDEVWSTLYEYLDEGRGLRGIQMQRKDPWAWGFVAGAVDAWVQVAKQL